MSALTVNTYTAGAELDRSRILNEIRVSPRMGPSAAASVNHDPHASFHFQSDSPSEAEPAFLVSGTSAPVRRHTLNTFDYNPLRAQGRPHSRAGSSAIASRSFSAPAGLLHPPPAALTRKASRYTPSPLSKTPSFSIPEEDEEVEEEEAEFPVERRARRLSFPRLPSALRRRSTLSLKSETPPSSFHNLRRSASNAQLHTRTSVPVSSSMTPSRSLPASIPEVAEQPFATRVPTPSTSRNIHENWMTAQVTPRFSRASLPAVVLPVRATPKNRAALSLLSRASSTASSSESDELPHSRSRGEPSTPSSRTSSLRSSASWDSLRSDLEVRREYGLAAMKSVPELYRPSLYPKLDKLKRAWTQVKRRASDFI